MALHQHTPKERKKIIRVRTSDGFMKKIDPSSAIRSSELDSLFKIRRSKK
jgi:hypothetical protein